MAGLNKVELIGRLGKDPEVRYMPNGDAVCNITVATSETWKDKNSGERKEKTEWHRVVFFGKVAEIAGEYLHKGSQCFVMGKLQTREYDDKEGITRYTTEVVVDSFNGQLLLLDSKKEGQSQGQSKPEQRQPEQKTTRQAPARKEQPVDDYDSEIPF